MRLYADEEVLLDALHSWGYEEQIGMVHEELGELLTAINQWKRKRIDSDKLISEIADAHIMIAQMAIMFGPEKVQDQIDYKIARLKKRLADYNAPKGPGISEV